MPNDESKKIIIVEKRGDFYCAFIEGHPEASGFGDMSKLAIGNLVCSCQAVFGVSEIKYKEGR
jgi:hypothetical protein